MLKLWNNFLEQLKDIPLVKMFLGYRTQEEIEIANPEYNSDEDFIKD